jgi:MFS family permease
MARTRPGSERWLVLVVGAVVFVDTMFYAAIAPLLPGLAHSMHLSKLSAGVMTASYPIGTLLGSLPGGVLAVRAGPRFTVCAGLSLLACSTVAFGFLQSRLPLDVARFVEGTGGACSWAGGLAWIIVQTPVQRRGALIGGALGTGIAGALFGPVVGTIASGVGRAPTFSAVVVFALALFAVARRLPSPPAESGQGLRHIAGALRTPGVLIGMWLVALPSLASGTLNVLGPLRLHRFGAGAAVIGGTYLTGAAIEAAISPAIGRLSDRRGRLVPLRAGLAAAAIVLAIFTLPGDAALLAALVVVIASALGIFWAPAMAMLSDAAETTGLEQGLAAALINLAWAGGQTAGAGGGGAIAKLAGDAVPMIAVAGLCAVTLVSLGRSSLRRELAARGDGPPS